MRIPLDYYRILGLPIQATAEQLRQAHRDRTQQLPRREYSEAAIAARKQLLDEAYNVLSDGEQRQAYDATFLMKGYELEMPVAAGEHDYETSYETSNGVVQSIAQREAIAPAPTPDPYTPFIEIDDHQLVGALLILLELGEYELILKLGRPYLSSGNQSLTSGRFGQPDIVLSDIVLTLAFACLELGREQWHQGQYENAAESLQTGQHLLLQEGLFASLRGEMQADLFKLRPYRILELLALPEDRTVERRRGLQLLQDMLNDRGGIDGGGDDQSGLNVDDFLRFIQQLRGYLTVAEQQALFEAEARRPSAVATYLAVYALLARGFAEYQPALIRRAKHLLIRLGTRQDVHLEQAICALLLGQTEEASRALELSQEYESLAFIREHSQGSPDLLPGLCLYAEQWLQNEVLPQFRDLAEQQAAFTLKDYFADEQVQAYLEELPNEPEAQWNAAPATIATNGRSSYGRDTASRFSRSAAEPGAVGDRVSARVTPTATATLEAEPGQGTAAVGTAERISDLSPEGHLNGGASMGTGSGRVGRSPQTTTRPKRNSAPPHVRGARPGPLPSRRSGLGRSQRIRLDRLLFLVTIAFIGIGALIFLGSRLTRASNPTSQIERLEPGIALALRTISEPLRTVEAPDAPLTEAQAREAIERWLTAKATALGEDHDADLLAEALVDPALTQWQNTAEDADQNNWYFTYDHEIRSVAVTLSPDNPNEAEVAAEVVESAEFYTNGQVDLGQSYDSTVNVRYTLVRQDDNQWRIQEMAVE